MARTRHRDRAEAFNLGAAGENAPDWVLSDPALLAAFDQGQADGAHHPLARTTSTKTGTPRPSSGGPAAEKGAGAPPSARPTSAKSAGGKAGAGLNLKIGKGGDGSGLLLAILLYPPFLAAVKYGPAGITAWGMAKFFNKTPGSSVNGGPVSPTNPPTTPALPGGATPPPFTGTVPAPPQGTGGPAPGFPATNPNDPTGSFNS